MSTATAQGKAFDRKLFGQVFAFTRPYKTVFWTSFALTIFLHDAGEERWAPTRKARRDQPRLWHCDDLGDEEEEEEDATH